MLYHKIESYIENDLQTDSNKVLIVDGARQVGNSFSPLLICYLPDAVCCAALYRLA